MVTEHIVDVREGQNSDGFDRYPYEEMEEQSLSILVEGEKQSKTPILSYTLIHRSYRIHDIFGCGFNLAVWRIT